MPQTWQVFSNSMITQIEVGDEDQEGRKKARNEGSYPTQASLILHGSQAVSRLVLTAVNNDTGSAWANGAQLSGGVRGRRGINNL